MYKLIESRMTVDGITHSTYGIHYDGMYSVSDISTDKAAVEDLIQKCNKFGLDPIHLCDIAEDFISGV